MSLVSKDWILLRKSASVFPERITLTALLRRRTYSCSNCFDASTGSGATVFAYASKVLMLSYFLYSTALHNRRLTSRSKYALFLVDSNKIRRCWCLLLSIIQREVLWIIPSWRVRCTAGSLFNGCAWIQSNNVLNIDEL